MEVSAFSGGKDSTAMVLRQAELGERFALLFTPTGNELPELADHVARVAAMVGAEVIAPPGPKLLPLIAFYSGLPNWRQRWCTRQIKIEPCVAWLKAHPGTVLSVGLRADEEDRRGLYGEYATYRRPLVEWGWGMREVRSYLARRGMRVPRRTDCGLCYGQRIGEWWSLWKRHPEAFAEGERLEAETGHTFRSPGRDTWPASLAELRARFEAGHRPRGANAQEELVEAEQPCRVCRL